MTRLRQQSASGFKLTAGANIAAAAMQFVQTIALARFLTPGEFGLAAMAIVIGGVTTLMADFGLGPALTQREEPGPRDPTTVFWLSVLVGIAAAALLVLAAPLFAIAFDQPDLEPLVRWLAIAFVVFPLGVVPRALLERRLAFKYIGAAEVVAALAALVTAIISAVLGADSLAVVFAFVAATAMRALVLLFASRFRPALAFERPVTRGYLAFGWRLAGQRGMNFVAGNADYILVGRILGARALGFYTLAFTLANIPSSRINTVLSNVMFPVLARVQDDAARIRTGYLRLQEVSGLLTFPLLAGMAATATVAIPVVYGDRWEPSIPILQILAGVGLTRAIGGTVGPLILAKGRTDLGLRWSVLVLILQVPAIAIGAATGSLEGVAWAFLGVQLLLLVLNYRILIRRLLGNVAREYVAVIARPLLAACIAAAAALPLVALRDDLGDVLSFVLAVVAGGAAYAIVLRLVLRDSASELVELLRGRAA